MTHHNEQGDTIMGRVTERPKVASHAEGSSLNAGSIPAASQLNEAVKLIAELDAKRTQGEWIAEHDEDEGEVTVWAGSAIEERHTGCYDTAGEMRLYSTVFGDSESDAELLANADFIAAAPLMAATVAQQAAIIEQLQSELAEQCRIVGAGGERELALMAKVEQQRAVLVQTRDRLYQARDFMPDGEVIFIDTAITAIDNVLGV